MAKKAAFDFTNVSEGGGGQFNKKHQATGDYKAIITKVEDAPSKKDGVDQWVFTMKVGAGTYPYYCKHDPELLWKIRNLWEAVGVNVPKKRVGLDPNKLVGRGVAVTLEDDDYKDKLRSQVSAVFPLSELEDSDAPEEEETEEETEEEEEETPPPKKKAKKEKKEKSEAEKPAKKSKPKPAEDEDEDELEELDIEDI